MPVDTNNQLESIARVATQHEEQCARRLAECRERLNQKAQRIADLKRFHHDYADGLRGLAGQSLAAHTVAGRADFVSKVNDAIEHEGRAHGALQAEFTECLKHWQQAHARAEAIRTLIQKQARERMRRHARREQASADERASGKPRR